MDTQFASQIVLMFVKGTGIAIFLLIVSGAISTILALILTGVDIFAPKPARYLIRTYSWIAQTTPPLILLFAAFYGFTSYGFPLSPIASSLIAFTVFATAYNFEILRASYDAVPKGQLEAARSLGIPLLNALRLVILPQVTPIAAGPYIGRATVLLKETSLASAISVPEIASTANGLIYSGANPLLLVSIAGAIYAALNFVLIALETRFTVHRA